MGSLRTLVKGVLVRRHHARNQALRRTLAEIGYEVSDFASPIVPVIVGDPDATLDLADRLRERGFLAPAIRPPSVPEGTSRLRISLTAAHGADDIAALVRTLSEIRARSSPR